VAPDVAPPSPIVRLEEHALAVDPRAIEDEFDRIWRDTAGPGGDDSSTRVRVLNLVAVASSHEGRARFEAVMQLLPQRHPCRGILALAESDERLNAVISAHCWRAGSSRGHVCSEEILLTGAPQQERELSSAVLALLVTDLPVAVWLMDEAAPTKLIGARLLDSSDSVILDSARSAEPRAAFDRALSFREQYGVICHDLAWGRLSTWRALCAQLFDGEDGAREIDQIDSIEVRGGSGARSPDALLLAAWLTNGLRLTLADVSADGDRCDAALYDGTRQVRLRIGPGAADGLDAVRIRTADADFRIERHADSGHVHVRESWDSGSTQRVVDQHPHDDASIIERALDGAITAASVYKDAVNTAIALCG
jgi:glucose-6-phosphate dehydrogenase assembly protein OpcA